MRIRTSREIGLAIRDRRRERGMDQAELARRVGVSRQWVIAIEKGKPRAELGLVLRALRALGLDVWIEAPNAEATHPVAAIDLKRVIDRARGKRDDD